MLFYLHFCIVNYSSCILAKKKKPLEDVAEVFAGNGKLMFMMFGGNSSGVILAINCREIQYDQSFKTKKAGQPS